MVNLYYKPSGKFTVSGIALGLVGGVVSGIVLGLAYSYIISYIPFIYLNALCTVGFSLLLGLAVGFIMRWGKVRNTAIVVVVALVVALVSLYFSWAVWMSVLLGRADIDASMLEFAAQPTLLWSAISGVNEVGAWHIRNQTVSGAFLWVIWAIEAAIILGGAVFMAVATATATPFCEACQSWCVDAGEPLLIGDANAEELKRRMEAKDFAYLKSLGPIKDGQQDWSKVELHTCPGCGQTNTLALKRETWAVDSKGKGEQKSTTVLENLLISKDDVYRLRQIKGELDQTQTPT